MFYKLINCYAKNEDNENLYNMLKQILNTSKNLEVILYNGELGKQIG